MPGAHSVADTFSKARANCLRSEELPVEELLLPVLLVPFPTLPETYIDRKGTAKWMPHSSCERVTHL